MGGEGLKGRIEGMGGCAGIHWVFILKRKLRVTRRKG